MKNKKVELKKIVIVLLAFLGILIAVLHSAAATFTEMEKQLQQNLEDVAKQNAVILKTKISVQYELLQSLAKELEGVTPETIGEKLESFEIFLDEFNLKRFAYSFPDGTTYSTDGEVTNLSYREFYQKGLQGQCDITGVLTDAIREEHTMVNVMTIPIFDESGNVTGVFGVAYDTEKFNESLRIESFDGKGSSCIVDESGEIMASMGSDRLALSKNIFEDVLQEDNLETQSIEQLRAYIRNNQSGSGMLYLTQEHYYYCVPVELMEDCVTWYILTVVPSELLTERTAPIQMNLFCTSVVVVFLVAVGALLFIMFLKGQHKRMLSYAYEDPMTKGANFIKFCMEMEQKDSCKGYVVVLDITNFNNISIVAGKEAGDRMILDTWDIISHALQKDELAAHIKEDAFILFLKDADRESLLRRIENISALIGEQAKDFCVYGIQAGYGIYYMAEKEKIETAYSKAKLAREYVVASPELQYAFYSEVNRVKTQHEKELEERFPKAMEEKEFEVWYQPKYSAADSKVVGGEALVRWRKKSGEMISPGEFIPLFEQNGMVVKLDEYMFREVCRQQKKWLDEGRAVLPVSVNISRASLYCSDVMQRYSDILQEYDIAPSYIQLEVTETAMEDKKDIRELLNRFRKIGIKILMDDFGTGYSSLATLSTQCFDTLKLDKTLIDHIGSKDGETLLYYIIRMGQQMGLHITAEGVEEQMQVEFLRKLKCDDIQGFYFSRPLPLKEYEDILV